MQESRVQEFRKRLEDEENALIRVINRNRNQAEGLELGIAEDEADRASRSHDSELLYNVHESAFARLKLVQASLKRMDRGEYGECVRCGEDINLKRLMAVPWATLCIECQQEAEKEMKAGRSVLAGTSSGDDEEDDPD